MLTLASCPRRRSSAPWCLVLFLALAFAGGALFADDPPSPDDATKSQETANDEKSPSDEQPEDKPKDSKSDESKPTEKEAEKKADETKPAEKKEADKPKADSEKPKTHRVQAGPFRATIEIEGTFEPEETTEYVLRLKEWQPPKNFLEVVEAVRHGTKVAKGTPLVKLRVDDLEKAVEDADRAAQIAKLDAQSAQTGLAALQKLTPMDLELASRQVDEAKEDLKRFLEVDKALQQESAEFYLQYSRFSVKSAEEELKQLQQMYEADDLTEETEEIILERTKMMADMARFNLKESEAQYDATVNIQMPRMETAQVESTERTEIALERAKTQIDAALKKAEIELAKSKLASAEADERLADLETDLAGLSDVRATSAGYAFYGKLREGSWADADPMREALRPGGRLNVDAVFLTVASPKVARVRAEIEEKNRHLVQPGVAGEAHAVAYPDDSLDVRVDSIDRIPIAPGKFVCLLTLANSSDGPFVPGMKCKAELVTLEKKNAIAIPKSAVFKDDATGDDVVYLAGEKPEKRAVKKGLESGDRVMILDGLAADDEILLAKPEEK